MVVRQPVQLPYGAAARYTGAFSALAEASPVASPVMTASSPRISAFAAAAPLSPVARYSNQPFPRIPVAHSSAGYPVQSRTRLLSGDGQPAEGRMRGFSEISAGSPRLSSEALLAFGRLPSDAGAASARVRAVSELSGAGSPRPSLVAAAPSPSAAFRSPRSSQVMGPTTSSKTISLQNPPMVQIRSLSPTAAAAPASPKWSTVPAQRRRASNAPAAVAVAPAPSLPAGVRVAVPYSSAAQTGGLVRPGAPVGEGTDDLYYDQKELFYRSHTRALKQSRSKTAQKKTDYQVEKRRQQSMRDGGSKFAAAFGGDED
eukprot:TRINITY_DN2818_c0_g2_i2.p1 TRINITY_DN2818_c0_g2~~TRINITY_DN2818_c0_g2_i2.p1  ORF type:complete len:349 (-),score=49.19 TRINITY_DN2818_c0_g2_i2:942-1886(-)